MFGRRNFHGELRRVGVHYRVNEDSKMELSKCHCGGIPKVTAGTNRRERREAAEANLGKIIEDPAATVRERQQATIVVGALLRDVEEVHCPNCSAWCHGGPGEDVRNLWNKAIERLQNLKPCCRASEDVRTDYDGQVMVRCNECHTRHLPLGTR